MTYQDMLFKQMSKGEEDAKFLVNCLENLDDISIGEKDKMWHILGSLYWNHRVTKKEEFYRTGFCAGVYSEGWQSPKTFDGVFKDRQYNEEFLKEFRPLDTLGWSPTFSDMVLRAKTRGAEGITLSSNYDGAFWKKVESEQYENLYTTYLAHYSWHFKLEMWTALEWRMAMDNSVWKSSQLIPIDNAWDIYHERTGRE